MPPMTSISRRKPVEPSERCGVMMAEKIVGSAKCVVVGAHGAQYTENMARKSTEQGLKAAAPLPPARGRGKAAGKAARVKGRKARIKADAKAVHGALPQWTSAEIAEAFRRFAAANPAPRGELEHINPFTLLVAVVLSAQATDAGVNKATPALFKLADTPEKMAKLGEARVRDLIKTIGLYRTKAKNVIGLSRKLVDQHGGKVPHDREALEALPGVGRKTANVVLNIAFGEPTIAVDTHIFRVGNRTGLAVGKTPLDVEMKLMEVVPERYRLHAHHWLILLGRYTCIARRPLCEKCVIADLCKWPGKTVNVAPRRSYPGGTTADVISAASAPTAPSPSAAALSDRACWSRRAAGRRRTRQSADADRPERGPRRNPSSPGHPACAQSCG